MKKKKIALFLVLAMIATACLSVGAVDTTKNYSYDFENVTSVPNSALVSNTPLVWMAALTKETDPNPFSIADGGVTGKCLKYELAAGDALIDKNLRADIIIPVPLETQMTISLKLKGDGTLKPWAIVYDLTWFKLSSGRYTGTSDWQTITFTFNTGLNDYVRLGLVLGAGEEYKTKAGTAYADDVSISYTTGNYELISDGGFDVATTENLNANNAVSGGGVWGINWPSEGFSHYSVVTEGPSSSKCAKYSNTGAATSNMPITQAFPAQADVVYTLTFKAKIDDFAEGEDIYVSVMTLPPLAWGMSPNYNSDTRYSGGFWKMGITSEWASYEVQFTAPTGPNQLYFYEGAGWADNPGTFWLDDVSIIPDVVVDTTDGPVVTLADDEIDANDATEDIEFDITCNMHTPATILLNDEALAPITDYLMKYDAATDVVTITLKKSFIATLSNDDEITITFATGEEYTATVVKAVITPTTAPTSSVTVAPTSDPDGNPATGDSMAVISLLLFAAGGAASILKLRSRK